MGLSNEERYMKTFWMLHRMRSQLDGLCRDLPDDERLDWYSKELLTTKDLARSWISKVDTLTGALLLHANRTNTYWIFGEGKTGYQGMRATSFSLNLNDDVIADYNNPKQGTIVWWERQATLEHVAEALAKPGFFPKHKGLKHLGTWWDIYSEFSDAFYAIWRYKDSAFPEKFKEDVLALFGEMLNRRLNLCFGARESGDWSELVKMETYLLLKHQAIHLIFEEAHRSRKVMIDGEAVYERVQAMNTKDLYDFLRETEDANWSRTRKYDNERMELAEKRIAEAKDPLYGPASTPELRDQPVAPVSQKPKSKRTKK